MCIYIVSLSLMVWTTLTWREEFAAVSLTCWSHFLWIHTQKGDCWTTALPSIPFSVTGLFCHLVFPRIRESPLSQHTHQNYHSLFERALPICSFVLFAWWKLLLSPCPYSWLFVGLLWELCISGTLFIFYLGSLLSYLFMCLFVCLDRLSCRPCCLTLL